MALGYGERRALNEISSVLASQWSNGMLPQIRFVEGQTGYSPDAGEWGVGPKISGNQKVQTSGITQPPNIAWALWTVFEGNTSKTEMSRFVESFYPGLRKFHDFLLTERDPGGEGLAFVFHPWATGSDNTPCYDALIKKTRTELAGRGFEQRIKKRKDAAYVAKGQRPKGKDYEAYGRLLGFFVANEYDQGKLYKECPFVVQDVLFNAILRESISAMAKIAGELAKEYAANSKKAGYYRQEAARNEGLAARVGNAIREKLFDEETGLFYSFDVRGNELIKVPTVHSFAPLLGGIASREQARRLIKHLCSGKEFSPENGFVVPSVPLNSEEFNPVGYARGPIWPVRNWVVVKGLENYDKALAKKVREQTIDLISQGFKGVEGLKKLAASLMEFNSFGEEFTTPSKQQYCHGWLWDSGFAAMGWRFVKDKPEAGIWKKVSQRKKSLLEEGASLDQARHALQKEFQMPLFSEYFSPISENGLKAGSPLGSDMMTWTAALFLNLVSE